MGGVSWSAFCVAGVIPKFAFTVCDFLIIDNASIILPFISNDRVPRNNFRHNHLTTHLQFDLWTYLQYVYIRESLVVALMG